MYREGVVHLIWLQLSVLRSVQHFVLIVWPRLRNLYSCKRRKCIACPPPQNTARRRLYAKRLLLNLYLPTIGQKAQKRYILTHVSPPLAPPLLCFEFDRLFMVPWVARFAFSSSYSVFYRSGHVARLGLPRHFGPNSPLNSRNRFTARNPRVLWYVSLVLDKINAFLKDMCRVAWIFRDYCG